ncbi:hypothetical protein [Bradyrhizobium sp. AUGA SZCCT0431]|uniref:hypothetical protein n=1 Tax=Bradyrhizobium sp. AUGA SZCCT0431 TaxID=2807674 RepID=UPI001BAC12DC|nr:hypothetical protein [Bradyrhizobium sp. AUGA SZCCT0431]MBR1148728.1 hypothetical protein [Bradyrhizobium sp. AUGA SZCCT0431]
MSESVRSRCFGPTHGVRLAIGIFAVLIEPLIVASAAQSRDLTGAWVTDAGACKKIFTGSGGKLAFAKDADVYGSGFVYEKSRLRGKIATCQIKTQKEDGDVLHLIASCSTDVALATVQFSLKIDNENQITRLFPGMPELKTEYFRCSP